MHTSHRLQHKQSTSSTHAAPASRQLSVSRPLALAPIPTFEQMQPTHGARLNYSLADIPIFPPTPQDTSASAVDQDTQAGHRLQDHIQAARSGGHPLERQAQQRLEQGLGANLSGVRVHTDSEADYLSRSVRALAFTTGPDIFFRSGIYAPHSSKGLHLLAHEATHVVQQATGVVAGKPGAGGLAINKPGDRFEQAAEANAARITGGKEGSSPIKGRRLASIPARTQQVIQLWPDPDTGQEVDLKTVPLLKLQAYINDPRLTQVQKNECREEYARRSNLKKRVSLKPKVPITKTRHAVALAPQEEAVLPLPQAVPAPYSAQKGPVVPPQMVPAPPPPQAVPAPRPAQAVPVLPLALQNAPKDDIDNILGMVFGLVPAASKDIGATRVLKDIKLNAQQDLTKALNGEHVPVHNLEYDKDLDQETIAAAASAFVGKKIGASSTQMQAQKLTFGKIEVRLLYRPPEFKPKQGKHQANLEIQIDSVQVLNYHIGWNGVGIE